MVPVHHLAGQLSAIAGRFYGEPSRNLRLVGVTGTNGKTSVSQLIAQALDRLGEPCGIIGTLGTSFYGQLEMGRHTTPDAIGVQATLAQLKQEGARAVAMECRPWPRSGPRRRAGVRRRCLYQPVARPSRLPRHHGSLRRCQARLFGVHGLSCRVINLDDGFGRALAGEERESRLISYSTEDASACTAPRRSSTMTAFMRG